MVSWTIARIFITGRDEEDHNMKEMAVVCPKSQPVQTLYEIIEHVVFNEAGVSPVPVVTDKGKNKGDMHPTRSNQIQGDRLGM
ncbi:hypothetical protein R3W88_034164 [Solanum pinnatisectum]|uniref:Uncharacterized protein n=1 Tax=Solanum pinnatisectum TaxID=50273 RepID=A0AAV9K0Z7_9SOLN|nr:hypothetical protein R3W88_034164 [Solanum pinnatisectum]